MIEQNDKKILIMIDLDTSDKQLLAALRQNSRMSVTNLAARLNLSRATVQVRIDRLVQTRMIQRFTIDVDASADSDLVRAIMLIELEGSMTRSVIASLTRLPEIGTLHTTNGNWDLVAHIEAFSLPQFDQILRKVREINGVLNSETSILLNTA